jgi:hypothetical protein
MEQLKAQTSTNLVSDGYTVSFNIKSIPSLVYSSIFSYSTVRLAKINSFKVALTFRILQLAIIAYIVGLINKIMNYIIKIHETYKHVMFKVEYYL